MTTLEISPELYRALQSLAVPFEDRSPEDVIWRLIGVARGEPKAPSDVASGDVAPKLSSRGGTLPNGLQLRLSYRGKHVPAQVKDSQIWVGDKAYASPSEAASAAAKAAGFPNKSLNGWWYFEYNQDGIWHRLQDLRDQADVERRGR